MKPLAKIALGILSILLGAFFIYSAYTKIISVQYFEYTMVDHLHLPWLAAAILARLFIGLEIGLGAAMVLNIYGTKKWVLRLTAGLLLVFTVYIAYLWARLGKDVNCGCMGDTVWMKPLPSILKNIVLLLVVWLLIKWHAGLQVKLGNRLAVILVILATASPFVFIPMPDTSPQWVSDNSVSLNLDPLYAGANVPEIDLRKGKHVVAFLSLSCPHCKTAAYKMQLMKKKNPALPIYFVLAGKEQYQQSFWEYTKAQHVPHIKIDADTFTGMVGFSWPAIYFINNGKVEAQPNYIVMEQAVIEDWLAKP